MTLTTSDVRPATAATAAPTRNVRVLRAICIAGKRVEPGTDLTLAAAGVLSGLLPLGQAAHADTTKPIKLLVGFPPGGGTDAIARTMADKLKDPLGSSVIVETYLHGDDYRLLVVGGELLMVVPASGVADAGQAPEQLVRMALR